MNVTTAFARTEEHASTRMVTTDVNALMDTAARTVISVKRYLQSYHFNV